MATSHIVLRSMQTATRRIAVYGNQTLPWSCVSSSSFSTTFTNDDNDDERGCTGARQHVRALPRIAVDTKRYFTSATHTTSRSSSISTNAHPHSDDDDDQKEEEEEKEDSSSSSTTTQQFKERAQERYKKGKVKAQESYHKGKIKAKAGAKVAQKGAKTFAGMFQQYGPVFAGTYFAVYVTTLGSLFAGVDSGLIDPVTILSIGQSVGEATGGATTGDEVATQKSTVDMVVHLLEEYSFTSSWAPVVQRNPHFANLAVAWVATKFTEPIRIALTMAVTPRLALYLGRVPLEEEEEERKKSS
mmetsp:Transcript_12451/g.19277  ORF Transcript_12451/g.19277 Transcript_12451/m.19277 type:complete len:301 (-) Transcript_12451:193-1095(-)